MKNTRHKRLPALYRLALITSLVLLACSFPPRIADAQNPVEYPIYMPLMMDTGYSASNKFLGIYPQGNFGSVAEVDIFLDPANALAGKRHSIIGFFQRINTTDTAYFLRQMNSIWDAGYIPFINLNIYYSSSPWPAYNDEWYLVPNHEYILGFNQIATAYASFVNQGGGRKAFLAPFPEMNDYSNYYFGPPGNYKESFSVILDIFAQKKVARDQVWWVFAPNGASGIGGEFENYYPGDDLVDVIGFSSYNYGYCEVNIDQWANYDVLYTPYLDRISFMAPNKPVVISQTGTTAERYSQGVVDLEAKNQWLRENYTYLAHHAQLLGILYYDYDLSNKPYPECNYRLTGYSGYTQGAANEEYQFLDTTFLNNEIP